MAHIADIIKYEGANQTFIWKHPDEDFNSLTQHIVHESQEAIFFMNGQALDLFGPGRYTLETENLPKIGKALNRTTGGETPFHCEVYFINKTVQMAIKWGTDSKVRFIEPSMGVPLEIGACGEMNLMVSDSRKLLIKLVGTMSGIAWEDRAGGFTKSLQTSFSPLISTAVKTHLSSAIKSEGIDVFEIDENLEKLSKGLHSKILPGFEEYGLTIPQFYITNISLPENDPNFKRMRDLHTVSLQTRMAQAEAIVKSTQAEAEAEVTAARRKIELERQATATEIAKSEAERDLIKARTEAEATKLAGYAEAEVMRAKGYTERDVIQAEVQKAYAEGIGNMGSNGGSGSGVMGDIVGLGVGLAAAGKVSEQMGDLFKGIGNNSSEPTAQPNAFCTNCGAKLSSGAAFCDECGAKVENNGACSNCGYKFESPG